MTTAEKIKYLRLKKGLSQEALGELIGVQKAAINKYETGRVVNIKRTTLKNLASALGVTPADLLDDDRPSSVPLYEAAAGEGRLNDGYPSDEYKIQLEPEEFTVKVVGRSMEPTLQDGDVVVVSAQNVIDYPRQIALVKVNGEESTLKRVEVRDNGIMLMGDNIDAYPPHFYTADQVEQLPVVIEGVLTKLIREF